MGYRVGAIAYVVWLLNSSGVIGDVVGGEVSSLDFVESVTQLRYSSVVMIAFVIQVTDCSMIAYLWSWVA